MTYFVTCHDVYDVIMLSNVDLLLTCLVRNESGFVCEHALIATSIITQGYQCVFSAGRGMASGESENTIIITGN